MIEGYQVDDRGPSKGYCNMRGYPTPLSCIPKNISLAASADSTSLTVLYHAVPQSLAVTMKEIAESYPKP